MYTIHYKMSRSMSLLKGQLRKRESLIVKEEVTLRTAWQSCHKN